MTISSGQKIKSSEVLQITKAEQVYTGTGFNSSQSGAGVNTVSYEPSSIAASKLVDANYIRISITATHQIQGNRQGHYTSIIIESKEISGAYSTSLAEKNMITGIGGGVSFSPANGITDTKTFVYYHTLTAGEKSNGVQLKLTSNSGVQNDGSSSPGQTASFTNIQTVIEVVP